MVLIIDDFDYLTTSLTQEAFFGVFLTIFLLHSAWIALIISLKLGLLGDFYNYSNRYPLQLSRIENLKIFGNMYFSPFSCNF